MGKTYGRNYAMFLREVHARHASAIFTLLEELEEMRKELRVLAVRKELCFKEKSIRYGVFAENGYS